MITIMPSLAAFLLLALPLIGSVGGAHRPTALFVFGDSYGDTGNHDKYDPSLYQPWRDPYGHSWGGKPNGRFSDGKILTDYIASFLSIPPPLPYRERGLHPCEFPSGMNFAFGGSGVFATFGPQFPTIGHQIHQLEKISKHCPHTEELIKSSLVLLVLAGNDYTAYLRANPIEGLLAYVPKVAEKIAASVHKLYNLGFRTFALANLEPTGCLPRFTSVNNYTKCNETVNTLSVYHNTLYSTQIAEISKLPEVQIIFLDQQKVFMATIEKFGNGLEPCCKGLGISICGAVDAEGKPLYTVCANPEDAFFWDGVHPTQAGWKAVAETYKDLLKFEES